jgi:hypothetical protein
METQQIGVSENETKRFWIKIAGVESEFRGTVKAMETHVETLMVGQNDGTYPSIKEIADAPQIVNAAPATALRVVSTQTAPATRAAAISGGVSVEGAARSTIDLLAAQAAGFAPARPLYDRGTPVIGLGVQNARASHRAWEKMPRLKDAVELFNMHVRAEQRRDVLIPIEHLAMHADGMLTGEHNDKWLLEPEALVQLATRLGVPQPSFLASAWPNLRAMVWNQMLATAMKHDKSTCPQEHALRKTLDSLQTVRARLRAADGGKDAVWAVLSDRYATFDVDQIAASLAKGLSQFNDARCEITYDGRSAQFDVLFHSNVEPEKFVAGEFFKVGYRVRTSDAGGGSIKVSLLVYQNLCLNLIVIDVATFVLANLRHIGSSEALASKFREAVRVGEQKIGHFLRAWNFAADDSLADTNAGRLVLSDRVRLLDELPTGDTFTEAELLAGVFSGLGKSDLVSIGRDDIPGLIAAHALDTSSARELVPVTRASVVNAITRYAHETVGRLNPSKQSELESQAGALLIGSRGGQPAPLPFMPPRKAQTVAV